MILYSSSPVQRLVGVAYVDRVEERDPDGLWQLATDYGGGLTRDELEEYFAGKKTAFGIMIRSAYDLFRLDLLEQFRLKTPKNSVEEFQVWRKPPPDPLIGVLQHSQSTQYPGWDRCRSGHEHNLR